MTMTVKRRKRHVSGSRQSRDFAPGRAAVTEPADEPQPALVADAPYTESDLIWHVYGCAQWTVGEWAPRVDERLDAMNADLYDLGDRVNQLIIMTCVGILVIVVGVGALLMLALS